MKAGKITGTHYLADMGNNIATVDLQTGIVYLNPLIFPKLPKDFQQFILLHEAGHLANRSQCDLAADKWAFREFVKKGHKPERAAQTLRALLVYNNTPMLRLRAQILENRALRNHQTQF